MWLIFFIFFISILCHCVICHLWFIMYQYHSSWRLPTFDPRVPEDPKPSSINPRWRDVTNPVTVQPREPRAWPETSSSTSKTMNSSCISGREPGQSLDEGQKGFGSSLQKMSKSLFLSSSLLGPLLALDSELVKFIQIQDAKDAKKIQKTHPSLLHTLWESGRHLGWYGYWVEGFLPILRSSNLLGAATCEKQLWTMTHV